MRFAGWRRIGQPFSGPQELHQLFSKYDANNSGQLEFNEFLVLFKDRLTDVQKTLQHISLKPAKSASIEPSLLQVLRALRLTGLATIESSHCLCCFDNLSPYCA